MNRYIFIFGILSVVFISACVSPPLIQPEKDSSFTYKNVTVKWLGHAGFEITGTKKIYIDPFKVNGSAKADFILATHDHPDHCDAGSIKSVQAKTTPVYSTLGCISQLTGRTNTLRPGEDVRYPDGIRIESVNSYNINKTYHPKNSGRGFILAIDSVTIYHAGDTDFIPEMENVTGIDIALLPIGGKYTMNVEEAAEAAKTINPEIVVPMHYNSERFGITDVHADPGKLKELLANTAIEVRILEY